MTEQQKVRVAAVTPPAPSGRWQPGTPQEVQRARAELEAIAKQCREARHNGTRAAEEKLLPAYQEARAKVVALEGPPLTDAAALWLPADVLKAALKARGVA